MHAYKVQRVCMEVVKYSCNDSVLKVFLASLVSGVELDNIVEVSDNVCFLCKGHYKV